MDIKLKNYNQKNITKHGQTFEGRKINKALISSNDTILSIIDKLKTNPLSPDNYKVEVVFEDFGHLSNFLFKTKKFIHDLRDKKNVNKESFPETAWSVDFENSIHITKNIYKKETSFTEYLNNTLSADAVLNIIFLHELGHSIQSQLKKTHKVNFSSKNTIQGNIQQFLNDSIPFNNITFLTTNSHRSSDQNILEKELSLASHYGMKEGFADMYCCIALSMIYPKLEAQEMIEKIIEGRMYTDKWKKEFYHSKQSMQTFLNDFKNNNITFKSFDDVHHYIEASISHTITTNLINEINTKTDNDNFVNHYFGVLKNKLKLQNSHTLGEVINEVNKKYSLNLINREENNYFKLGFELSSQITSEKNQEVEQVVNRVNALRNACMEKINAITKKEI